MIRQERLDLGDPFEIVHYILFSKGAWKCLHVAKIEVTFVTLLLSNLRVYMYANIGGLNEP